MDETNPFEISKCKSKNRASVSDALALFRSRVDQVDKFDSPCLQNKDFQYSENVFIQKVVLIVR